MGVIGEEWLSRRYWPDWTTRLNRVPANSMFLLSIVDVRRVSWGTILCPRGS